MLNSKNSLISFEEPRRASLWVFLSPEALDDLSTAILMYQIFLSEQQKRGDIVCCFWADLSHLLD